MGITQGKIIMSISDCFECYSTPCTCGYEYKDWSDARFAKFLGDITLGRNRYRLKDAETKKIKKTRELPFSEDGM